MTECIGPVLLRAVLAARLTARQREVFIDIAVIGRSCRDVAADLGCHHSNVQQLAEKARTKLAAVHGLREDLAA